MTTLELYRTQVAQVPTCVDAEFTGLLAQYRAGDEDAGRAITGGHLAMVLALVESLPAPPAGLSVLEAVEEANAGLVEALDTFSGTTAGEFRDHSRRTIVGWLHAIDTKQS